MSGAAYRYAIERTWADDADRIGWVLLHPSIVSTTQDPSLHRCLEFARRWGFGSVELVYLYAMRTTDASIVRRAIETLGEPVAVGPDTDARIVAACDRCTTLIAAWGNASFSKWRDRAVTSILRERHPNVLCLGRTHDGYPISPIDAAYEDVPEVF